MTLLQAIKSICESIEGYTFECNAANITNVVADKTIFPCIYFEEYKEGKYMSKYGLSKSTKIELYFMKLAPEQADAQAREQLRESIEREAVGLFLRKYNESGLFKEMPECKFFTQPSRFDVNEVSIMLQIECVMDVACGA